MRGTIKLAAAALALLGATPATADDGYDLWLRYRPLPEATRKADLLLTTSIVGPMAPSPITTSAEGELIRALSGLTGRLPPLLPAPREGTILLGTPATSPRIAALHLPLGQLGDEGYLLRNMTLDGMHVTVVAANSDRGLLYGAFALIREVQLGHPLGLLDIASTPKIELRMLDHWDNLDRTVERGYAGQSIFDWWKLPGYVDPRLTDYARADASIGINAVALNNVNAKADSLTAPYIAKAAAIADVLRPYGIRVYLSARFSSPIEIGGLKTADPLDPAVRRFWRDKADEIYRAIPDFGGFLVKASSEGQPGPGDYHRSHADGANMMAAAVAPHGGRIVWRAFVYAAENSDDRVKQAYSEFKPLDGKFAPNVLLQVKNGPLDFQPREPFHPLFGAMPGTPLMLEVQLTKEYLGQATHLVYLGAQWEEVLKADTFGAGPGATVAKVIERGPLTGMAGVANIGSDRDWTGSVFNQANWYAYGRLAWDPQASSRAIAQEWAGLTFTPDPRFVWPAVDMMMQSREAVVDYMEPLGLAHIMGTSHHYGPAPWVHELARPEWNPVYYHRADANGIGFDRTETGSNALGQYAPAAAAGLRADPRFLLWFHHENWDAPVEGTTLWRALVRHYDRGVADVAQMRATWDTLRPFVDGERWRQTADYLAIQANEARWWRDACLSYFMSVNHRPLPAGEAAPLHDLAWYEAQDFPYAPH